MQEEISGLAREGMSSPTRPILRRRAKAAIMPGRDVPTTAGERLLLFLTVMLLPLESHIRIVPGVSSMFIMFGVLSGYVALNRLWHLDRVWLHPVFVAAFGFTAITAAIEFASPLSRYDIIGRFSLMIGGAMLVASLCRDRAALKMFLYGYIGAALWLGLALGLTSYGTLSGVVATDFQDASLARVESFRNAPIQGNLNAFANHCVQGGLVAMAFVFGNATLGRRAVFAVAGIFCLVASTLPMSRGAIVNAAISFAVMLKAHGIKQGKVWFLAALLVVSAVILVPDAIWSRMAFMTKGGEKETRVTFYESAMQHFGDYVFMGVGAGNYFQKWGFDHGFGHWDGISSYTVYGVHNAFLQVLIYWGAIALLCFLAIIWLGYRCLPRSYDQDVLALAILGIAVSLLLQMPFASEYYYKGFSLGLGVLVGYQRWLRPNNQAYA